MQHGTVAFQHPHLPDNQLSWRLVSPCMNTVTSKSWQALKSLCLPMPTKTVVNVPAPQHAHTPHHPPWRGRSNAIINQQYLVPSMSTMGMYMMGAIAKGCAWLKIKGGCKGTLVQTKGGHGAKQRVNPPLTGRTRRQGVERGMFFKVFHGPSPSSLVDRDRLSSSKGGTARPRRHTSRICERVFWNSRNPNYHKHRKCTLLVWLLSNSWKGSTTQKQ